MSTSPRAASHPAVVPAAKPVDLEELGENAAEIQGRSPWQLAWARLRHDRVAIASVIVIALITLAAIFAPLIARLVGHGPGDQYPYLALNGYGLPVGPNRTFLFGADDVGRDVLVRVVYGARISLIAGVVASGLAVIVGAIVGMVAGYFGTLVDTALSRFMDVILSFPLLLFAIALVSIVGPSLTVTIAVIAFFSWAVVGRIIRGQTLSLREKEFVEAARSLGASDLRIMFVDILPNLVAPILVYTTLLIPSSIVFEASLSFLGLGVVPPTPSWGNMLSDAEPYYKVAWWFIIYPGTALLLTTLAFNLLGDSVRDALDPRYARLFKA
ncbi:MAG: ABC transporter permease [Candidatus Dormiibacterota bacterium]|jgi:peptide/nickel transport system permease protein